MQPIDILYAISGLPLCYAGVYGWSKTLTGKFDYKNIKIHALILLFTLILGVFATFFNTGIKVIAFFVLGLILIHLIYTKKIIYNIIVLFITAIYTIIAELLMVLLLFNNKSVNFMMSQRGTLIGNIISALILFILFNTKLSTIIFNLLIKITDRIKTYIVFFHISLLLVTSFCLLIFSYHTKDMERLLIINIASISIYSFIVVTTLYNRNRFVKVTEKYNVSLAHLQEYERMIDDYRTENHENENQLKIINEMLTQENNNTIDFVKSLLNEKSVNDQKVCKISSKIPNGGLRATIHLKMQKMKRLNIKHELHIGRNIKASILLSLDDETLLNVCTIISIYLDNAIEHTQQFKDENRIVSISISLENKVLCIAVGNYVNESIEIDMIEEKGYSTKENNRGYGLTLAKETINKNRKLSNEKIMKNNFFTQKLKIKM